MARRLDVEGERDPLSAAVAYWSVVAARGAGDPEHAWDLAVAAWMRAPLSDDSVALRRDLDRLVLGVVHAQRVALDAVLEGRRDPGDLRLEVGAQPLEDLLARARESTRVVGVSESLQGVHGGEH